MIVSKFFDIPDVDDHEKWTFEIDQIVPKYDIIFTNDEFTKTLFEKRQLNVVPVILKDREKIFRNKHTPTNCRR